MSAGHYENFPVASRLLPARLRMPILAIYRFARGADDVADEGDATASERLAKLEWFERQIEAIAAGDEPAGAVFIDLAQAMRRFSLPVQPFRDLLSAFRQDVTTTRYARYADLVDYCRRSANPIGRLLLQLFGADNVQSREWSDAICTALQLINFWQDIAIDWRKDRVYLPQEDLMRFGADEQHIAQGTCDDAWRALMRFEVERTRALLESGRPLTRALPWRSAIEIKGVVAGGHRVLDAIDAVQGDVFRKRPRISGIDWAMVGLGALLPASRHRAGA